jgi:hypothetical protein
MAQDAIYKPHDIGDEVFVILLALELPYNPLLFKCKVSNIARISTNSTYYHLQPMQLIESDEFIKSHCSKLTFRTIRKRPFAIKDTCIEYDSDSHLTWSQQFALNYDNLLLDAKMQVISDNLQDAINLIHKINQQIVTTLNDSISELLKRNITYYTNLTT